MPTLLTRPGGTRPLELDRATLEGLHASGEFFWLDLHRPATEELEELGQVFGFHPLAIEDASNFGQRPKLDDYEGFVFLVIFGASETEDGLAEVHCFYSDRFLVTVHRDDSRAFSDIREHLARRPADFADSSLVLHRVMDGLVDSFFAPFSEIDDRLDRLEDQIFEAPSDTQLKEVFAIKRRLVALRKAITPQRDLLAKLVAGLVDVPGMTASSEHYFRDVYDHMIRLSEMVDSYRDLLSGAMDVYLSTVSNRLNAVMKQLAVIATVFLPLSFVTGFFGQNFAWMVDRLGGVSTFLGLGIGVQLLVLALCIVLFRRRGLL